MTEKVPVPAFHFLPDDGMTVAHYDGLPRTNVVPGLTLTHDGPLILCERGLHASRRAIDALGFAQGSIVCRVEMGGDILEEKDKLVAQTRTVLWMGDATRILHEFACEMATEALDLVASKGEVVDPRSRNAIAVKRLWLDGKASDSELAAARAAARDAARDAAWDAAWDAARAAAIERYNTRLEEMLTTAFAPAEGLVIA